MHNIVIVSGTNSLKPGGIRIFTKEMFSQNHHVNPLENNVTSGLGVFKVYIFIYTYYISKQLKLFTHPQTHALISSLIHFNI